MQQLRLGLVGVGNIGRTHFNAWLEGKLPEVQIAAVADRKESSRQWVSERCDSVTLFEEAQDLIDSDSVDAVLLAVPHYQHPPLAIRAFSQGKHVLSEKPAGVYTKQVKEMNAAAEASGLVFGIMFNQRTNCVYRKMRELVQGGSMGQMKRMNWIITDWYRSQHYYDSGEWRASWAGEGGGVLLNQCPHNLDLLQWICGMPDSVTAFLHYGKWHKIEVEDDVTAYLTFPNGATGVFVTTTADAPGTNRLEVTLDKGKIVVENDKIQVFELEESEEYTRFHTEESFIIPKYRVYEPETDGQNIQHPAVINAFAGAILHQTPLIAPGSEGILGLTLSNAMHLSSWLGKTVNIPLEQEDLFVELLEQRIANSKVRNRMEL
jgi:predicted dehydrogenase